MTEIDHKDIRDVTDWYLDIRRVDNGKKVINGKEVDVNRWICLVGQINNSNIKTGAITMSVSDKIIKTGRRTYFISGECKINEHIDILGDKLSKKFMGGFYKNWDVDVYEYLYGEVLEDEGKCRDNEDCSKIMNKNMSVNKSKEIPNRKVVAKRPVKTLKTKRQLLLEKQKIEEPSRTNVLKKQYAEYKELKQIQEAAEKEKHKNDSFIALTKQIINTESPLKQRKMSLAVAIAEGAYKENDQIIKDDKKPKRDSIKPPQTFADIDLEVEEKKPKKKKNIGQRLRFNNSTK